MSSKIEVPTVTEAGAAVGQLYRLGKVPSPELAETTKQKLAVSKIDREIRAAMQYVSCPSPAYMEHLRNLLDSWGEGNGDR